MRYNLGKPINIGIIGLGFGAAVHAPAFRLDPRCRVTAIAGHSLGKADQVAARLFISNSSDDWRVVIDDASIDVITIATPPTVQPEIAKAALSAGKHVFCEKPLAASFAEAQLLAEFANRSNRTHAIDFIFPELPLWSKMHEFLANGVIGQIRHAVLNWRVETYAAKIGVQSWKNDVALGGGVLNNFASHAIYNLEWLFGPIRFATTSLRGTSVRGETCVHATLDFAQGFPAFVSIASDAFLGVGHRLEIYGEEGTLILHNPTSDYAAGFELYLGTRETGKLELVEKDPVEFGKDSRIAPVSRLARRFLDSILSGAKITPDFSDGARVQRVLDELRTARHQPFSDLISES